MFPKTLEKTDTNKTFEITDPKDGSIVKINNIVQGDGAIPYSNVSIYIGYSSNPSPNKPQGYKTADSNGEWSYTATFGDSNERSNDKTYYIQAKDDKGESTQIINVIRNDN